MKKIISLFFCLAALNFVGCAKAGLKNVDPSWTDAPSVLTVVMTEAIVQNQDDVADDLPDYADNFMGWFTSQMSAEFQKQAGLSPKIEVKDGNVFNFVNTKLGKKDFNVPQPKFDEVGVEDGYIVSIAFINVSRISETKMTGLTSAETKHYLQFEAQYSIANASEKKVVTSGTVKARETLGFAMTKSDWETTMANLVEEIIKDTPLKKN